MSGELLYARISHPAIQTAAGRAQWAREAGHGIWPVPVVVNRWSVRMPSGHDDLGTTPLVPESMIDRMCQRDLMSNDDHADHHSHGCGIRIVADTAGFSHPLSCRGRVAVG